MIHPARLRSFALLTLLFTCLVCSAPAQKQEEVLLNFSGVLKTLTNKEIVIEPDPDNSMTFIRSKRTRIIQAGKETDGSKIQSGTPVAVECTIRMNGELEAITVTVIEMDQSPSR
jgi:hypothetical protein